MIIRSLPVRPATRSSSPVFSFRRGLLLALLTTVCTLAFSGCGTNLYQFPQYNFAGRPVPPSKLSNRVMVALTTGNSGALQILDAQRDIRNSVYNPNHFFFITGYSANNPTTILSFPDELKGYVYSNASPFNVTTINYGTEAAGGTAATLNTPSSSFDLSADAVRVYSAQEETGQLFIADSVLGSFALNLPNVYRVAVNPGDTIALAMVRNSDTLYRIVKLNANSANPPGAVDCQPTILPVYCVVPVPGTFDRPVGASFSLDGSNAYILNCGVECGGGSNGGSGVSFIPEGSLQFNLVPTSLPYPPVVTNTVAIPGGVTEALSDGTNLYLAGQQFDSSTGLFAGFETTLPLATLVPAAPVSISDGTHTKILFGDDGTLWIGATSCANGDRHALFAAGNTTQAANYNCLTRAVLPTATTPLTAAVVPAINQGSATVTAVPVPYENQNEDPYYYGSLTGLCWVQGLHKVYTAYGGQVHAFNTADGSEIDNSQITVQGTALDVTYMDASTDTAN